MADVDEEEFMPLNGSAAMLVQSFAEERSDEKIRSLFSWRHPESVPLRIALVGSWGADKAALGEYLSERLDLPHIESVARTVEALGYPINEDATTDSIMLTFLGQMHEEQEYSEYVSSSTVLETLAFLRAFHPQKKHLVRALTNVCYQMTFENYNVVFYVQPNPVIGIDGVRDPSEERRKLHDAEIKRVLDFYSVDYMPLSGSVEEKSSTAWTYLDDFGLLQDRYDPDEDDDEDDDPVGW